MDQEYKFIIIVYISQNEIYHKLSYNLKTAIIIMNEFAEYYIGKKVEIHNLH